MEAMNNWAWNIRKFKLRDGPNEKTKMTGQVVEMTRTWAAIQVEKSWQAMRWKGKQNVGDREERMRIRTVNGKRKMKRSVKRKNKKVDYLQEDSKLKSGIIRKKIPMIGMGLLMVFYRNW